MNSEDIAKRSDSKSLSRSKSQGITARLYKVDNNVILYTVASSNHDKQYIVRIQLLDLTDNKLGSLKDALDGDIRISCTCPAFSFAGYKYITYKAGVGLDKETRAPDIRNPNKEGMACKHILAALEQMKSDYDRIYKLIESSPSNKKPVNIRQNKDSDEPTSQDLEIVNAFRSACSKLYDDFSKYVEDYTATTGKTPDPQKFTSSQFFKGPYSDNEFYKGPDPSQLLTNLSKPVLKSMQFKFIGKLNSLKNILKQMSLHGNGFNTALDDDVRALTKKLNATLTAKTESLINNIIFSLIGD